MYLGVLELWRISGSFMVTLKHLFWFGLVWFFFFLFFFLCSSEGNWWFSALLKFLPYVLNIQRLVVMTSGGELPKDQRSGMIRIITEKPKCYSTRNSWVTSVGTPDRDLSMKRFFGFSWAWNTHGNHSLVVCLLPATLKLRYANVFLPSFFFPFKGLLRLSEV